MNSEISQRKSQSKQWLSMSNWKVKMIYEKSYNLNEHSEFVVLTIPEMANTESATVSASLLFENGDSEHLSFLISLQRPTYANYPAIVKSTSLPSLSNNECGCSEKGVCSQQYTCTCESGYVSQKCTFKDRQYLLLQSTLASLVEEMKDIPLSASQVFERISALEYSPQLLSLDAKLYFLDQIQAHSATDNKADALILISNIAQDQRLRLVIDQAVQKIASLLRQELTTQQTTLTLSSLNIDIQVHFQPSNSTIQTKFLLLPQTLPSYSSHFIVQQIHFKYAKYEAPVLHTYASTVLSVTLYNAERRDQKLRMKELKPGVHLQLPINQRNKALMTEISQIYKNPENVLAAMASAPLRCAFWNQTASLLSYEGCSFISVSTASVHCYCNHLTDFMSFLEKGNEVIDQSNYSIFSALNDIGPEDLLHNLAMQMAVFFWIIYILLAVLVVRVDHSKLKRSFFRKLFQLIHERAPTLEQDSERRWPVRYEGEKSSTRRALTRVSTFRLATLRVVPQRTESCSTPKMVVLNELDSDHDNKPKNRKTIWNKVKNKLNAHLQRAKDERKCCCVVVGRVTVDELESNNLPFNLFKTTSPLTPRLLRLSIFSFTLLSELAICAFFSDLEAQADQEDDPFFWEGMFQNLWVALYSVLLTMLPMMIVGCFLSIPKSMKRKLELTTSLKEIEQSYKLHRVRVKCRTIVGLFFFFILSNFFLLYMLCFCHLASADLSQEWIHSSVLSIVIDQLIFEVAPAFLVGLVVVVSGASKCCRSSIGVAVLVEVYRSYRNLTDP